MSHLEDQDNDDDGLISWPHAMVSIVSLAILISLFVIGLLL